MFCKIYHNDIASPVLYTISGIIYIMNKKPKSLNSIMSDYNLQIVGHMDDIVMPKVRHMSSVCAT